MVMSPKRKWRLLLLIVGSILTLYFGLSLFAYLGDRFRPKIGDLMDWKSRYLSGAHGVDCGRVRVGADASLATQCALKADSEAKPFRVIYEIQGFDSLVAGGVLRTPDGKLLALSYIGCPSGCGYSIFDQRVSVKLCPQPFHLYVNPKGRINCFQPNLSYPQNVMSPNSEPY
jgi:hypothetical protein